MVTRLQGFDSESDLRKGRGWQQLIVKWFGAVNVVLAILFMAGCAPIQSDIYFIETTPTPTPTPIPTPSPTPEVINLEGHGQQTSSKFDLSPGLAMFKLTHDGDGHFTIVLLDDEEGYVQLLVETTGAFNGSTAAQIGGAGTYILEITADGNWKVEIAQ